MNKAFIFDMDGVLIDSEVIYLNSLVKYLNTLGINTCVDELSIVTGMKLDAISDYLIKTYSIENVGVEEMMYMQDKYFDIEAALKPLKSMEGLEAFLDELKFKNKRIALASSSDRVWIDTVVDSLNIRHYFDVIISGESVIHSKPNPEIFIKAAKLLQCEVKECIVIEDSINGIQAGIDAGMFVIGFKGSLIKQNTSKANIEVKSFQEISIP